MAKVKQLFFTPILMVLVMVLASAIVPFTIDNQEYVLTDSEQASSSSRVTGNESALVWGYSSTYTAGSTVYANISASYLDANTIYTLEWGATDQMGGYYRITNSVNITNVTSYSTSHSWSTINSTNSSQQNLWNSTWKIEFSLTTSNITLFSNQTTMFVVGSRGTLILYPSSSTYATWSSITSSVYAINCYYNVDKRLEYEWTSPNGSIILSGGQNFTGTTKYLTSPLPSSATGTPGTYTHTGRLYQQGTLIKTVSTNAYVVAPGTGYEIVYLSSQPSSYMAGDTVSANITAINLNPNTTYTLEWEGVSPAYGGISSNPAGSVNITNVTWFTVSHSWSTVNASNTTQQILYNNSWRIQANLYASNLTLATNQTTTFAVGTGGMLSVSTPASTYLTGSSFYPSIYATGCFYDVDNGIEYRWIDPNGIVLLSSVQNFTGTSQSLGFNVPSSSTSTTGVYTLVVKLFQQGSLIVQNSVNVNIISTPGTGAEMVYANVQYSTYIVGSTVWSDISATNLDPNTNYTLEWAPIPVSWSGFYYWYATDSISITNVSNYSASYSWLTSNSGNSNTLAADTWKIYAELSSSTILLSSGMSNNFTIQNSTSQPFDIDVNAYGGIGTTGFNTLHVYNAVVGETYRVYMNITNSNGYTIDSNDFQWTAQQSNFSWNQYWNGLSPDNYCVNAFVYSINSSIPHYDTDSDCFQMTAPPPVNNTLSVGVNAYGSVGTTGSSTLHAWDATVGETHWVNQSLTDVNGYVLDNFGFYWTANQSNMSWSYSWTGLSPGNYCVQGYVVSLNSSNGDSDTDCFQITSPPTPPSIFVYAAANSAPNSASGVIYASSGQASTLYNVNWTLYYSSGSLIDYGMMPYYGGGLNTSWSLNWTGLLPGLYCLEANIFLNISLIDSDSQCFTIQNVPITGTINVSLPSYTYTENDPFVVAIYAGNLNPSTLYTVTWNLIDQNVVIPTYSGLYNFSGMTYDYSAQTFSGLSHGSYWIGADLWDSSGNLVDSHNFTFIVAPAAISGCTDPLATNFNINATVDDGSCVYPPPSTNTPPVCSINIGSINSNSTTLSYSHQLQLPAGNHYIITSCIDLDGDAMMLTMTNSSASLTASGTGNVSVGMWVNVPTNFTGSVIISVSWTDGNHLSSSILDIQIIGGATGGNSSGNSGGSGSSGGGGGSLPGFTGLLTVASLAGIAILRPKRRD